MQDIKNSLALALTYMDQQDGQIELLKQQIRALDRVVFALVQSLKPQGEEIVNAASAYVGVQQAALAQMEALHRKQMEMKKMLIERMAALAIPDDLPRQ